MNSANPLLVPLFVFFACIGVGVVLGMAIVSSTRKRRLQAADAEAEAIRLDAQDRLDEEMSDAKERITEYEDRLWSQNEKEISQLEARVEGRETEYRKKRSEADRTFYQDHKEIRRQSQLLDESEKRLQQRQQGFDSIRAKTKETKNQIVSALAAKTRENSEQLKTQIVAELENSFHIDARKRANRLEDEAKANAETIAKRLISIALGRFSRASCTERGIGTVELASAEQRSRLLGPEGLHLKTLETACGVDLAVTEDNTVSIAGYDPVRRELTTRCLEKLLNEKRIDPGVIERVVEKTKEGLLRKIEEDGRRVSNELGCADLHIEIKKMLGSLRYRYSFAQNQYFHVAEVGWLCALLASELGGDTRRKDGRRSGLLHDIGKAMDHSIEGGHAVIGADFIQKWGEAAHIVHAVRAHHYEEQPNSDLAFLVIAADAMSGARPGARRQTVNTYNQKIEALSTIGDGFPGVLRTMIFNAGREVRVVVDSRRINDLNALGLCRDIADKIEAECSYPGQIKVVVVRETVAEALAK